MRLPATRVGGGWRQKVGVEMSWFPLPRSLMESEQFKTISPIQKVYLWLLMGEFNRRGGTFYKSDLEIAVTLHVSEKSIRRARKVLSRLGWIKVKPGFLNGRGQRLATTYLDVTWSRTSELKKGEFFAQMHYHTFHMMLNCLRIGTFKPVDLVVYVFLTYWRWKCQNRWHDENKFYITKSELRRLTNVWDAPKKVETLHENLQFSSGKHLFEFGGYDRLMITDWATAADPEEHAGSRRNAEQWIEDIRSEVEVERIFPGRRVRKIKGTKKKG